MVTESIYKPMERSLMVQSSSNKDVFYDVVVRSDGSGTCTCMAFRFSKGPRQQASCKHLRKFTG
jgi:hypothetical protein